MGNLPNNNRSVLLLTVAFVVVASAMLAPSSGFVHASEAAVRPVGHGPLHLSATVASPRTAPPVSALAGIAAVPLGRPSADAVPAIPSVLVAAATVAVLFAPLRI